MTKKIAVAVIVGIVLGVLFSVTAFAVEIVNPMNGHRGPTTHGYSPNPSTWSVITVVGQWVVGGLGHNLTSTVEYTVKDGCKQVWRQYWRGPVPVGEPVFLMEFCKK